LRGFNAKISRFQEKNKQTIPRFLNQKILLFCQKNEGSSERSTIDTYNVSHMNSIPIRTLKHETRRVLERVSHGETLEIRRRNEKVAVISPFPQESTLQNTKPDYPARLKKIYPEGMLAIPASELLAEERGAR
jgi:antitoxin (DNA-binding transcriptional repressor) of toxin-antitoxin stability system